MVVYVVNTLKQSRKGISTAQVGTPSPIFKMATMPEVTRGRGGRLLIKKRLYSPLRARVLPLYLLIDFFSLQSSTFP